MKILLTVDPEIPVPPTNYGGIERIADSLIKAYRKEGHEVYLVANKESSNKEATKIFGWPSSNSKGILNIIKNTTFLSSVYKKVKPDIIHSFSRLLYLYPLFITTKNPIVQTYQRYISKYSTSLASIIAQKKLSFTCCGAHMVKDHPIKRKCTPIHNFTDTDFFSYKENTNKEYLFFLGRIEDIKGTKEAIEVAIKSNKKLIIAGNIQKGHESYFETYIKQHLNNPLIEYIGPIDDEQKKKYLDNAYAFLFPIKWEEPFGIVMAEAMACGVPVIGFDRGSVPEVVKDGVTGFIVNDVSSMAKAVNMIDQIDRSEVRKDSIKRFSLDSISNQYISLFKEKING